MNFYDFEGFFGAKAVLASRGKLSRYPLHMETLLISGAILEAAL